MAQYHLCVHVATALVREQPYGAVTLARHARPQGKRISALISAVEQKRHLLRGLLFQAFYSCMTRHAQLGELYPARPHANKHK